MSSFKSLTFYFFTFCPLLLLAKVFSVVLMRSADGERSYPPNLKGKAFSVSLLSGTFRKIAKIPF